MRLQPYATSASVRVISRPVSTPRPWSMTRPYCGIGGQLRCNAYARSGPHAQRLRHSRKYAEGELGEDKSFYFRGQEGSLNLRAQNLVLFLQIAEGVDDGTWLYH